MPVYIPPQVEHFLDALAAELAISDTRYEQAETSYTSLGDWLHRPDSTLRQYSPQVYVQGSFGLGTVIKPITEQEDYDVDSVCELRALSTAHLTQKKLKQMLEVEVRSYHKAHAMTKPVREGRRCWVLDYADGAQFHMDIVPAVPDAQRRRLLIEKAGYNAIWSATAIAITDNERWNYTLQDNDWCGSNPKGYLKWFRSRMASEFEMRRRVLAEATRARVEDIPEYRVRTSLQSAIMILKRHRDLRFAGTLESRPISIILTTLSAHAYESEHTIGQALYSILQRMDTFIEVHNGRYVIRNPTDPIENFADKWADYPERAKAFFDWLAQARRDFAQILKMSESQRMAESIAPSLGSNLAQRALKRATTPGGLLRGSSSAAPTAGFSFPNQPRVITTPKGFA